MAFNVEITIGVNQNSLKQAQDAYKRLGDSADDANARMQRLATDTNTKTKAIREAAVQAAAGFERFAKSIESGVGAQKALDKLVTRMAELRSQIAAARSAGSPVPDDAVATLRQLEQETGRYVTQLGSQKAATEATRRSIEDATRAAGGLGGGINSLSDIAGLYSRRLEQNVLQMGLWIGAGLVLSRTAQQIAKEIGEIAIAAGAPEERVRGIVETASNFASPGGGFKELASQLRNAVDAALDFEGTWKRVQALMRPGREQIALFQSPKVEQGETWFAKMAQDVRAFNTAVRETKTEVLGDVQQLTEKAKELQAAWSSALAGGGMSTSGKQAFATRGAALFEEFQRANAEAPAFIKSLTGIAAGHRLATDAAAAEAGIVETLRRERTAAVEAARRDAERVKAAIFSIDKAVDKSMNTALMNRAEAWGDAMSAGLKSLLIDLPKILDDLEQKLQREITIKLKVQSEVVSDRNALAIDIHRAAMTRKESLDKEIAAMRAILPWLPILRGDELKLEKQMMQDYVAEQQNLLAAQLGGWVSFLSFLGDTFGGFFSKISKLAQNMFQTYSQLQQAGQQMQSAGGMMGAFGGWLAMAAPMIAVMVAAYQAFKTSAENRQARKYNTAAIVSAQDGDWLVHATGMQHDAAVAIQRTVDAFLDAIGGSLQSFADMEIRVRRDGKYFQAWVEGVMIGKFESIEEATSAALLAAFKSPETMIRGLSDLVAQGFKQIKTAPIPDSPGAMSEIQDWLSVLREVAEINWTQGARGAADATKHILDLWDAVAKLNLATPATAQAWEDLKGQFVNIWQDWRDAITGREKTPAELLAAKKQEAVLYNKQFQLAQANIAVMILETKAKLAALQAGNLLIGGGHQGGGGAAGGGGILGITKAFSTAGQVISGIANVVATSAVASASVVVSAQQAMFDALNQQIVALEALAAELAKIPLIDPGEVRLPGGGGRGGRREAREDLERELARPTNDVAAAIYDANLAFEEMRQRILDAGFGAARAAELLAEAAKKSADAVATIRKDVIGRAFDFIRAGTAMGGPLMSGLRGIDETAAKLQEDLQALADAGKLGAERFERLKERIEAAAEAQREALVGQAGASLLLDLYTYLGDDVEAAKLKFDMAVAEFQIRRAELELAMRVYNMLDEGLLGRIDDLIDRVIDAGPQGGTGNTPDGLRIDPAWLALQDPKIMEAIVKEFEHARELLESYIADGRDALTRELLKIAEDFTLIRKALGNTAEVIAAEAKAYENAFRKHLSSIEEYQRGLTTSSFSPLATEDQFAVAKAQFADLARQIFGGDYSRLGDVQGLSDTAFKLAQQSLGGEAYTTFFKDMNSVLSELWNIGRDVNPQQPVVDAIQAGNTESLIRLDVMLRRLEQQLDSSAEQNEHLREIASNTRGVGVK